MNNGKKMYIILVKEVVERRYLFVIVEFVVSEEG